MRVDWNDYYNDLNWFKPIEPPQLLPKDLLKYSREIKGSEVDKQILNVVAPKKNDTPIASTFGSTSNAIHLMNGDSLQLAMNKVPNLLLNASGNVTVTNIEQRVTGNGWTETHVTYRH